MVFDTLLFISYAHIDNQAVPPSHDGWVSRFHASLEAMLSMRIGRPANIWRDDKLSGNDIFADQIVARFSRTALMISVLSPRYVESDWCTRELREFCEQALRNGGVVRGTKSRVFKVLKSPVEAQTTLPAVVQGVLGYPFFAYEDNAPLELDPAYGERFGQDYNRRVCKLAWDLAQSITLLESDVAAAPAAAKPVVYLAECNHDRRDFRELLEAELKLHGHTVLPDQRLPLDDEAACVEAVAQQLGRCSLAIHLVGNTGGAVPDGPTGEAIVVLQNRLAAERSRSDGLQRLIWLPADTRSDQPTHQAFIEALRSDARAQAGADLLSAGIEEFKAAMHAALHRLEAAPVPKPADGDLGDASPMVYLVCTERDRKASLALRKHLQEQGINVELPAFEGDAAALREANRRLLAACDAVVVFYGAGDEAWKRSTDAELMKLRSLRVGHALQANYTVLAEPRNGDKDDLLDMHEPNLIDTLAGFDAAALGPLLTALRAGRTPA